MPVVKIIMYVFQMDMLHPWETVHDFRDNIVNKVFIFPQLFTIL